MSPLGSINPLNAAPLARIEPALPKIGPTDGAAAAAPTKPSESFGQLLDGVAEMAEAKEGAAQAVTRQVLLGQNDQIHQSVLAMQEASVAFSMMIEVRNKLVESYQELMRMQV